MYQLDGYRIKDRIKDRNPALALGGADQAQSDYLNRQRYRTWIHAVGLIWGNEFMYKHNIVYYPNEYKKNNIEARRIVSITPIHA